MRRTARPIPIGVLVEHRLHTGSRYERTTVWAILSATVGTPNVLELPSFFGISTARTGGGK